MAGILADQCTNEAVSRRFLLNHSDSPSSIEHILMVHVKATKSNLKQIYLSNFNLQY